MTIHHAEVPSHWNYFLCLEEDIERLQRWIEFTPANENVYSIELARLLMTAAAEADVMAKAICKAINPQSRAASINAYQEALLAAFPMLPTAKVLLPRYGLTFHPWSNWGEGRLRPPDWWTGNNKVKHHRSDSFSEANLKNVLNAVAALLVLLLLYYRSQRHSIFLCHDCSCPEHLRRAKAMNYFCSFPMVLTFPGANECLKHLSPA